MVMRSIERWLIFTETLQDTRIKSSALIALQAVHDAITSDARQLMLVSGLPVHVQDVLRDIVRYWPNSNELTERLRCYEALVDVVLGIRLSGWRAKWIEPLEASVAHIARPKTTSTIIDAAAESDFQRARKAFVAHP